VLCRGFRTKVVYEQTSTESEIDQFNTGSPCEITWGSVAIPRLVLLALAMAAHGLELPSVSPSTSPVFPYSRCCATNSPTAIT
jgi:hypothetical protein